VGNNYFKSLMINLRSGTLVFFSATGDLAYKKIFRRCKEALPRSAEDQQLLKIGANYGPNYQRI
jgi:hypothetical protein